MLALVLSFSSSRTRRGRRNGTRPVPPWPITLPSAMAQHRKRAATAGDVTVPRKRRRVHDVAHGVWEMPELVRRIAYYVADGLLFDSGDHDGPLRCNAAVFFWISVSRRALQRLNALATCSRTVFSAVPWANVYSALRHSTWPALTNATHGEACATQLQKAWPNTMEETFRKRHVREQVVTFLEGYYQRDALTLIVHLTKPLSEPHCFDWRDVPNEWRVRGSARACGKLGVYERDGRRVEGEPGPRWRRHEKHTTRECVDAAMVRAKASWALLGETRVRDYL